MANLPVPNPRTAVAGEFETAAYMNAIRDAINFLANPPEATVYQSVAQSFTSGAAAALTFDATITYTYGGHSNTTNNTRYAAQVGGTYLLLGTVAWTNVSTGNRNLTFNKNGSAVTQFGGAYPAAGTAVFPQVSAWAKVQLLAGDYVEAIAYQDSGSTISTHAGGSTLGVLWIHA